MNDGTVEIHRVNRFLIWSIVIGIVGLIILCASPLWKPLVLAGILALSLDSAFTWLGNKNKFIRKPILVISLLVVVVLAGVPVALMIESFREFIAKNLSDKNPSELLQRYQGVITHFYDSMAQLSSTFGLPQPPRLQDFAGKAVTNVSSALVAFTSNLLASAPEFLMSLFIFCLSFYFYLTDRKRIQSAITKISPLDNARTVECMRAVKEACRTVVRATIIVGVIQALLMSIGSLIFSVGSPWLVFALTFLSSFLPLIGTTPVGIGLALIAFLNDSMIGTAGLIGFAILSGSIDNIVRPYLVSGRSELHPLLAFISVLGGLIVFGFVGLFLGPIIFTAGSRILRIVIQPSHQQVKMSRLVPHGREFASTDLR